MNTLEQNQALIAALLEKKNYNFDDLCCIVSVLRGEGGCPWDIEQTHKSIRTGMIEECYEVVEAIDKSDVALLREELGDVLLQIVFHADIEKDAGNFNIDDVAHDECIKMITRHPHVFSNIKADTSEQVLENWEIIKSQEKQRVSLSDKLLSIPPMLPALMRASKVIKKTEYAMKMSERELIDSLIIRLQNMQNGCPDQNALGELLRDTVALCRRYDVDAEEALSHTTDTMIEQVAKQEADANNSSV